jgi:hypothetical protein
LELNTKEGQKWRARGRPADLGKGKVKNVRRRRRARDDGMMRRGGRKD